MASLNIAPWAFGALRNSTLLTCGGINIDNSTGVHQGDPLAPVFFSVALQSVLERIADSFPNVQMLWYLDDGLLMGYPDDVAEACKALNHKLAQIDLQMNKQKCELLCSSTLPPIALDAELTRTMQLTEWSYLGSPMLDHPRKP